MRKPNVTVGITVKNSADTISECIDSILKSSYQNFEILVVDAFSTDGTWEILKSYGPRMRAFQKKGNISVGRNEIIKNARGELIAFTDSDCIVDRYWLEVLVDALKEKNNVAAGGFVGTQENANYLQRLIGRELADRFKNFPKYVLRLPFMSLCVRTAEAKKTLLDENLGAAEDADFGYRLSKKGKIIYVPSAKVWHNHRGSLWEFFRQQFSYGKFALLMYSKVSSKAWGDHISKPTMTVQPPLFLLGIFCAILSYNYQSLFIFSAIFLSLLGIIYLYDSLRLSKNIFDFIAYFGIFFTRTLAWTLGFIFGIKSFLVKK